LHVQAVTEDPRKRPESPKTWQWSSQVDFSGLAAARLMLAQTNALVDASDAEREGKHLVLPADLRR
jgi:hypothetical protein